MASSKSRERSRSFRGKPGRRGLRFESLESRRLLAVATDLVSIRGQITDSFIGGNFANVALDLYRDDGDGQFEPNAGDPEVNMAMTDATGNYAFTGVTAGSYFVLQPAQVVAGRSLPRKVSPLINVTAEQVAGQPFRTIDSFQTTQSVIDAVTDSNAVTSTQAAAEAIGGSRDLLVDKTQGGTGDIGTIAIGVNQPNTPNLLSFDSLGFADGRRIVTWDGAGDDATIVNDGGLGTIDLTNGGQATGMRFVIGSVTSGTAQIRLYTDDGVAGTQANVSQATLLIPALQTQPTSIEYIPFTSFQTVSGTGVDLTRVGAIQLQVIGGPDYDAIADLLGTVGPNLITQNFDNAGVADLELTKTLITTNPTLNQNVVFDVVVTNNGPDVATGIEVTDRIPAGITNVTGNASSGTFVSGTGSWSIPSLAVNASATLRLTGQLTSVDPQVNVAEITAAQQRDDDSPRNNNVLSEDDQDDATVTATRIDLQLDKSVSNSRPNVGDQITFTLTLQNTADNPVTNATLSTATGIVVEDRLPAGLTLIGNTPSAGTSFNTTSRRWSIPALPVGVPATLELIARVDQAGEFINTAEVIAAGQSDLDSSPANNLIAEDDQDDATVQTPIADLSLIKTVANPQATVGENVTFTITVNNAGPDNATGVQVRDVLPAGLTYVSDLPSVGTYEPTTGVWAAGSVTASTPGNPNPITPTLQIVARVDNLGVKTNTATVIASDQSDPDSTPNAGPATEDDTAAVTLTPSAVDLSLLKTVTPLRPGSGDTITYTIVLSNAADTSAVPIATATNISVTDLLPAGLILQNATFSAGNYTGASGIWTVPTLAAGTNETLTLSAILDPGRIDVLGTIINTAEVTAVTQFDRDSTPDNGIATEDDQASIAITPARADLSLTKTVDDLNADVGEEVTFTITARHDSGDPSGQFVVLDVLPAGLQYVRDTVSIGDYDPATGRWTIPELDALSTTAAPQTATLQLVATTLVRGTLLNTAEIIQATLPDPDSTPGNNLIAEDDQADASIQAEQIDLSLTKTVDDLTPRIGQVLEYEVIVRNDGLDTATGVVVSEDLPTGLTLISATPTVGSFNTSTRRWTVGTLAPTASATLAIRARVNASTTITNSSLTNTAEVFAANEADFDSTPNNNDEGEDDQASVTVRVPIVDLSLAKTIDNASPNVGDRVAYEIIVTNDGDVGRTVDTATNLVIRDVLPAGVSYQSNSLNAGSYDPASGEWTIESLADDASATLTIFAIVDQSGTLTNTAQVIAVDQDDTDSTPDNNIAAEDDQASVTATTPVIDLSLLKTATPPRPSVGDEVTFTLTLRNDGPDDATGVIVRDTLPPGFNFQSATPAGVFDANTGLWTVGSLANDQAVTLELRGTMGDVDGLENFAEVVDADQFDRDSVPDSGLDDDEDDIASAIVTLANADLSLTKSIDNPRPNLGDSVTFTVSVRNTGPDPATNIRVRDFLPDGLDLTGNSTTVGDYVPTSEIWTIGELSIGQTATLTLTTNVNTEAALTNVAEIISAGQRDPDSTPGNGDVNLPEDDRAAVDLQAQLIDLALTKTINDDRFDLGEPIEFELTLTNTGPTEATGVRIADPLPAGLTFVSSATPIGGYNAQTGLWTVPSLPSNESVTLRINALLNREQITDAILRDGIVNFAEVIAADQPDRNSVFGNGDVNEDDADSVLFNVTRADLSVTKSVDNPNPGRGDTVRFLITLSNDNNDPATGILIRDLLPTSLTLQSATPTQGTFNPATGLWNIDRLEPNQSATLQIEATVTGRDEVDNVAEIIAADQLDPDSVPGNAAAGEDDLAAARVTPQVVDISVTATVSNEEPLVDEIITITLTATNGTPGAIGLLNTGSTISNATGVVIRAGLPDGLTLIPPVVPQRGTYDPVTGLWNIGNLAAGESVDLVFTARVDTRGLKTFTAEVIETNQFDIDSTPGNNVPTEDDEVELLIRAPRLLSKRLFLSR